MIIIDKKMPSFTDKQLEIILDAVEDYAVLVDDDLADDCGEILDIIEAHMYNKKRVDSRQSAH